MENFAELNLNPAIASAITELGFEKPTPIQAQALPLLLAGETDFLGMAATGTGKTAAFGIPLLQKIQPGERTLQAVVLCPTRELASQTARQLTQIGQNLGINVPAIYGGGRFYEQRDALRTAPIIVATPGRLIDHLEQGNVSLSTIKTLVLDEADEMISMGFEEALETILAGTSREVCRTWLFSATLPRHLQHVAETYMKNPKRVHLNQKQVLSGTVQQVYYTVRDRNKARGLCKLIDFADDFYGLIFVQTKIEAQELAQFLRSRRYHVDSLHGDKEQAHRERTLAAFRTRQVNILVCTDVAARGLDVSDLTHVVNFSLPNDTESYVHRIGRTGRGGKQGIAMSLVEPRQLYMIPRIEKRTRVRLEQGVFPSKKAVSARMLHRYLPRFASAPNAEKAMEILDEAWKATLAGMTHEEIASRFLALALPELFEEEEGEERERPAKKKQPHARADKPVNVEGKRRTYARDLPPVLTPAAIVPVTAPPAEAAPVEGENAVEISAELPSEMPTVEESGLYLESPEPVEVMASSAPVEEPLAPGEEIEAAVETPIEAPIEALEAVRAFEAAENAEAEEAAAEAGEAESEAKPFEKKPFGKKPFGQKPFGPRRDFGERRQFGDRPQFGERRQFGDRPQFGERRQFGDRPQFGERRQFGDRPQFGERREFGKKPFGPRREFGERRQFGDRPQFGERRQFGDRPQFGERRQFGGERREFGRKPFGPRREFGDKPFAPRPKGFMMDGEEVFLDRKPIERMQHGAGKPFARKSKAAPGGGERREFGDRPQFGERREFGDRPYGQKPFGRKPFGGGGKSFGKKPFGRKPFGSGRPPQE